MVGELKCLSTFLYLINFKNDIIKLMKGVENMKNAKKIFMKLLLLLSKYDIITNKTDVKIR